MVQMGLGVGQQRNNQPDSTTRATSDLTWWSTDPSSKLVYQPAFQQAGDVRLDLVVQMGLGVGQQGNNQPDSTTRAMLQSTGINNEGTEQPAFQQERIGMNPAQSNNQPLKLAVPNNATRQLRTRWEQAGEIGGGCGYPAFSGCW